MELTPISVDFGQQEKVCPFRTFTKNIQISQAEMHQIIEYPECYYDKCFFYEKKKCKLAESKLMGY